MNYEFCSCSLNNKLKFTCFNGYNYTYWNYSVGRDLVRHNGQWGFWDTKTVYSGYSSVRYLNSLNSYEISVFNSVNGGGDPPQRAVLRNGLNDERPKRMGSEKESNISLGQPDDRHCFNVWYGTGFGWDINIFGLGTKFMFNGPNANIVTYENGKLSYMEGTRWFNFQFGLALANVNIQNLNGNLISKVHLGQMEISTNEGMRYSPLSTGFHFGVIGFSFKSSRSYKNAGFEYYDARQKFSEITGFPLPWR